jgi:hypothetical protein
MFLDLFQLVAGILVVQLCVRQARPIKDRDAPFRWRLRDPKLLLIFILCPLLFPRINDLGSWVQTHLVTPLLRRPCLTARCPWEMSVHPELAVNSSE